MTVQTYTIQKGDTLTKIAKEHYGLSGGEAYKKALEIAKDNNIANPNLIYAGATLNLLFDDEPEQVNGTTQEQTQVEAPVETVIEKADNKAEERFLEKYKELTTKQSKFHQYLDSTELYAEAPEDFNPETDTKVSFIEPEALKDDGSSEAVYKEAVLNLAQADIETNDIEDEDGKKDGQLSYEEFEKAQMKFFETSQANAMRLRAEDNFALEYLTNNGVMPSEDMIAEAGKEIYEGMVTQYKAFLSDAFQAFDLDNSGFLDKTEVATQYLFMDASSTDNGTGLALYNENDELLMALDGTIDFEDSAIYIKSAQEEEEYRKVLGEDANPVFYNDGLIQNLHEFIAA